MINVENSYETELKGILENMNATNIFVSESLDFVSADIPVNRIIELLDYKFIYKLGDEPELEPLGLSMSQAKNVIGASGIGSGSYSYTGDGVTIGVIDTGVDFSHPDLQGKNAGKVNCYPVTCTNTDHINDHGTALAVIIAGDSSTNSRDGIAPDSRIFDVSFIKNNSPQPLGINPDRFVYLSRALDLMAINDIDIAMTSLGNLNRACGDYTSLAIVIDKAVDYGISFSVPIGNENNNSFTFYSCGFNLISVGSVDNNKDHYFQSSQGPAVFTIPTGDSDRIKPEITAIGVNLDLAKVVRSGESNYKTDSGTSYANAFVAGASALIKEKQSDYNSLEIKSALLLGADWKASVPATANDYDNQRTGVYDKMNKYGFGVLNIEKSLDYANDNDLPNIILDNDNTSAPDDSYRITANEDDQVKVLLSWFIHPRGSINSPILYFNSPYAAITSQYHNYDVEITYPDGTVKTSNSDVQNNEFIVFNAPETGNYDIVVSSDGFPLIVTGNPYVIASTHGLDKYPFETTTVVIPPTGSSIFSDDFEGTLSQWTNTGDEQIWEILTISGDKVASSDDCSTYCYLVSDTINASQATTLTFDRYIDSGVDRNEGLKVLVSTDNGVSYTELVFYSQNYGQDDSTWHTETLDISSYQSSTFKVKFTGVSSYSNDIVRIDDVSITGLSAGTVIPPVTSSQPFSQTQTVNKRLIDNSDIQETIGTISVNQDITIDIITLEITITHEDHDEVRAYLVSPDGEKIKVLNRPRGIDNDLRYTHIITLPTGTSMNGFVGDNARGDWTLTMGDYYRGDVGTVHSWKLSITGT